MYSCYPLWRYLYKGQMKTTGKEPHLLCSHQSFLLSRRHPEIAHTISADVLDLGCGCDVVHVHLSPDYATAQRGTSAVPCRFGCSDTSSLSDLQGLGLVPIADLPSTELMMSLPLHLILQHGPHLQTRWWKDSIHVLPIASADCSS
jgi:hypothetical protein